MVSAREKGFSFIEAILVLTLMAILTAIAIPRLNFAVVDSKSADAQSRKIATALRRTRRMAISDASENSSGFALRLSNDSYEIVNLDTSDTVDTQQIEGNITISGSDEFKFGPLGNLLNSSDNELTVSSSNKSLTITVIPATGMVKCSETQEEQIPRPRARPIASPFR